MNFQMVQLSSLEKVRENDGLDREEICRRTVLAGERLSYQICMRSEDRTEARVFVESELAEHVKLYLVKSVFIINVIKNALIKRGAPSDTIRSIQQPPSPFTL